MAAHLMDILDDLANVPAEINGVVVPVYYNATLKNGYDEADLPARILQVTNFTLNSMKNVSLRTPYNVVVNWAIQDILLFRNAGLGRGLGDMAQSVTEYAESYVDSIRGIGSIDWTRTTVTGTFPVLEYPAASGKYYNAVVMTVEVLDIVKG